ncbi:GroES-like protein [Acephala macrosclerotiorum]|nr:GroES-like protein [Acephala macrosclerotiorum]
MKGILLEKVGGEFTLVDALEKPEPGPTQVLVKSLVAGINPVEGFMQMTGMLVTAWPIVLGCDASGAVVEVGSEVKKFKVGDAVFGCTRLGTPGYCTFQEYFLMDENLTFKKPEGISVEAAATIGVGILTACLGLISGTKIKLEPNSADNPDEWIIILGGSAGVGQYAVAKICGYKFVKGLGADATFSYKLPLADQLAEITKVTKGNFSRCFDASAMASETGMEALAQCGHPDAQVKHFSTTNDWVPIEPKQGVEVYLCSLGQIGRSGSEHTTQVNQDMEGFIPLLEKYFDEGLLKPMEYEVVGDVGVGEVLKGLDAFNGRKSGEKKVLVRIAAD